MPNWRVSIFLILLFSLLIFLQYRLWFQAGGVRDFLALKKKVATQEKANQKLKKANEELSFQIKRLQNSQENAEANARNELGMIKRDEIFYQIVK